MRPVCQWPVGTMKHTPQRPPYGRCASGFVSSPLAPRPVGLNKHDTAAGFGHGSGLDGWVGAAQKACFWAKSSTEPRDSNPDNQRTHLGTSVVGGSVKSLRKKPVAHHRATYRTSPGAESCALGFLHGDTCFIVEIETIKVKGIVQARYMPSQGRLCALVIFTTTITSSRWHTIVVQGPVGELQGASAFQSDAVFRPVTCSHPVASVRVSWSR